MMKLSLSHINHNFVTSEFLGSRDFGLLWWSDLLHTHFTIWNCSGYFIDVI